MSNKKPKSKPPTSANPKARAELSSSALLGGWRPIQTAPKKDYAEVDVWLQIYASPRSFGMSDAFRVTNAYRKDGGWYHRDQGQEKEIFADYITHWMPIPKPPNDQAHLSAPGGRVERNQKEQ